MEGSASPRESTLAELVTLPCLRGGSGIKHPLMNAVVPIPERSRWVTGRSHLRCDLIWPDERVAVEYNRFAKALAKHLGTRARPVCSEYPARQLALRRELLG